MDIGKPAEKRLLQALINRRLTCNKSNHGVIFGRPYLFNTISGVSI